MSWLSFFRPRAHAGRPEPVAETGPEPASARHNHAASPITEAAVLDALRRVDDPELGVNIIDLGLVYGTEITDEAIAVRLTMTTMSCPLGDHLTREAEQALQHSFPEARRIKVELVWDPPWGPELITQAGKRQLGWE